MPVDSSTAALSVKSDGEGEARRGSGGMSSTLVETVSINYEDFSDSFLTCGTCLCVYDGVERAPKLLACSHTVCHSCLEHIIEAQVRGGGGGAQAGGAAGGPGGLVGSFRCPICRETITVPRGGVAAFPPSFIVNQVGRIVVRCDIQQRSVFPSFAINTLQPFNGPLPGTTLW